MSDLSELKNKDGRWAIPRLPTEEDIELPKDCMMVQENSSRSVKIYWGKKKIFVGEGLTEVDAILSAYKNLCRYHLKDAP